MAKNTHLNNHSTSLRLPREWHDWIEQFADKFHVKPAWVYRACVREFIQQKSGGHRV